MFPFKKSHMKPPLYFGFQLAERKAQYPQDCDRTCKGGQDQRNERDPDSRQVQDQRNEPNRSSKKAKSRFSRQ